MDDSLTAEQLIALTMKTGEYGVKVMALLDEANTSVLGTPEITKVKIGAGKRPGILISGHDLWDLKQLLEQSKDSGVDIYTHSEMLPGHAYPELKEIILISMETMEMLGGIKEKTLQTLMGLLFSQLTV